MTSKSENTDKHGDDLTKKKKDKHHQSTQSHEVETLRAWLKDNCNDITDIELEFSNVKSLIEKCKKELNTDNIDKIRKCVCDKLKIQRIQKLAGIKK